MSLPLGSGARRVLRGRERLGRRAEGRPPRKRSPRIAERTPPTGTFTFQIFPGSFRSLLSVVPLQRALFVFARMSCSEQSTSHGQASDRVWSFPNCALKASRRKKRRKGGAKVRCLTREFVPSWSSQKSPTHEFAERGSPNSRVVEREMLDSRVPPEFVKPEIPNSNLTRV